MTKTYVIKKIIEHLEDLKKEEGHSLYFKKSSDRRISSLPDVHIIYRGDSCHIWIKAPKESPTKLQLEGMADITRAGALAVWFDSYIITNKFIDAFVSARYTSK